MKNAALVVFTLGCESAFRKMRNLNLLLISNIYRVNSNWREFLLGPCLSE
jgi:hypothetical protein